MKRNWIGVLGLLLAAPLLPAQVTGTVSYKIDGRSYSFQNAVLRCFPADGYLSLDCERAERGANPARPGQEFFVSMTIQVPGDEKTFAGVHEASSPDEMPVYFGWYEVLPGKDKGQVVVREVLASLDSGDQNVMRRRLSIDAVGPPGAAIRGSFSGKLFDGEGQLHTITDGLFAVPRTDG